MKDRKEYIRNKVAEHRKENKRVELQLSNQEHREWQRIAKKEGLSVNQVIKNMAVAYKDTTYFIPAETNEELRKLSLLIRNIANNINQLSHSANIFHEVDENLVFSNLQELDSMIRTFVNNKTK